VDNGSHVFALLFQLNDYWKVGEIQIMIIINKYLYTIYNSDKKS